MQIWRDGSFLDRPFVSAEAFSCLRSDDLANFLPETVFSSGIGDLIMSRKTLAFRWAIPLAGCLLLLVVDLSTATAQCSRSGSQGRGGPAMSSFASNSGFRAGNELVVNPFNSAIQRQMQFQTMQRVQAIQLANQRRYQQNQELLVMRRERADRTRAKRAERIAAAKQRREAARQSELEPSSPGDKFRKPVMLASTNQSTLGKTDVSESN